MEVLILAGKGVRSGVACCGPDLSIIERIGCGWEMWVDNGVSRVTVQLRNVIGSPSLSIVYFLDMPM